jgi:hypothetical protein
LLSILVASVYAIDSKNSITGPAIQKEKIGNVLYKAVEPLKHVNDSIYFDLNRSFVNITPTEPVIINDSIDNNSSDVNISNSTISNDSVYDDSLENVTEVEPVVESRNLITVYAQASSYMDSDYPGGVWYKVVWDKDLLDSYYGYCEFNPKGVYENEISVMAHGRYYSCDFSALTGYEKSQSGCSDWNAPKYVGGAIVSVSKC